MGISLFMGGSKRLPGWFGALIYCHNGDFTNFLKLVPECLARASPRVPVWVRVGGVKSYLGNAQMQSTWTHSPTWVFPKNRSLTFDWIVLKLEKADVSPNQNSWKVITHVWCVPTYTNKSNQRIVGGKRMKRRRYLVINSPLPSSPPVFGQLFINRHHRDVKNEVKCVWRKVFVVLNGGYGRGEGIGYGRISAQNPPEASSCFHRKGKGKKSKCS